MSKPAAWPEEVTLINESRSEKWAGFGDTRPNLYAPAGIFGVKYVRADLALPLTQKKMRQVLDALERGFRAAAINDVKGNGYDYDRQKIESTTNNF